MMVVKAAGLVLGLAALTISTVSKAENLEGVETPEFVESVEMWLDGKDEKALSHLAALSREGNVAAQILLASIARRSNMHMHVTSKLSRKERIELLRIPEGLSGKSWLIKAQETEPLATALLQATRAREKGPAVSALIKYGEPLTGLLVAQSMLLQGQAAELIEVLQGLDEHLPREAVVILLWALRQQSADENGQYVGSARHSSLFFDKQISQAEVLAWAGPSPMDYVENPDYFQSVRELTEQVPSWTPMRDFCERNCPSTVPICTAVGVSELSSAGPFAMRSPLESVISNERYWDSPRVEGDLARQIKDANLWRRPEFQALSSCFFLGMRGAQKEHGFAK